MLQKFLGFVNRILLLSLFSFLSACSHPENPHQIRVGVMSGPEAQLMEAVVPIAKEKYGLDVKITEFDNYALPNQALNDGSIDINMFQTIPFLNADSKAHGYDFKIVGKSFIYPMALYSKQIKSLKNLPTHALVAVPNDESNEGRALLLLQSAGLIKLDGKAGMFATPKDIISNPKAIVIKELDAAQTPRALSDVTLAAINTNYAVSAGLSPTKDGLFIENKNSPFVNVFVVKSGFENDARVNQLIDSFQSEAIIQKAQKLFHGNALPGW